MNVKDLDMLNLEKNILTTDTDTFFSMTLRRRKKNIQYNWLEREIRLDVRENAESLRVGKEQHSCRVMSLLEIAGFPSISQSTTPRQH